jgi:CBS domain-containing protein
MEIAVTDEASVQDFLRRHSPFDRMAQEEIDFLSARLRSIEFAPGESITDPDAGPAEWFYILREGRIVGDEQGEDERISGNAWELVPGESFPIGALLDRRPVRNAQRAETDVTCLTMDRAAFDELRGRSAVFSEFCTSRLSSLLEQVHQQVQAQAVRDLGGDTSLNVPLDQKQLREPLTCPPDTPIREALQMMGTEKIGSMVVADSERRPMGIFTLKDLMNRVALKNVPLDMAIGEVMTRDPVTVSRGAFAFEAAMLMAHNGIHHLCVVDDQRLVGVISERDLFSMQRVGLVNLSKSIGRAGSVPEIARIARDIHQLVAQMIAQGVKVGQITQIITLLNDQILERFLGLALAGTELPSGLSFTWLAFGSEGRHEQTLKTDQDNGILFAAPEGMSPEDARRALLPLADRVNRDLDACGFTLCPGDIMARNPECCLSLEEWEMRFVRWIDQGTPEHLLKSSIFFDFRALHGPNGPARALRDGLLERTARNSRFLKQMAANALRNAPPLGLIRDFRLSGSGDQSNTIDLKLNGVTPFIDAARIFALANRISATNTHERLSGAAEAGVLDPGDASAWSDAYDYIRMLRMRINQEQAMAGLPLSNRIAPDRLNDLDRRILKEAFREARRVQSKLALDYQL